MNTIAKRILNNVQKYPQKIAIVAHDGTRETTWTELLEVATKIACHARREGLSGIVPILQGRTMEYVASILGLNMAGIAVVNLSDTYPEERIKYICEDVGATVCADNAFVERAVGFPAKPFEPSGDLSDIAMLLYTSGSTGTPKGVVYDNNCLLQSMTRGIKEVGLDENVIWANTSTFSFTVAVFELLVNLAAGATVHILTNNCRKDIGKLTSYFNKHQITHAFIPFQVFRQMGSPLPFMKLVLLIGEKITDMVPQKYKIMNCYGMCETTVFVTHFLLDKAYDNTPIGKASEGMFVYLLDENSNLCDEGEICIAGPIARGYWNCPELTGKTFVRNPYATGEEDKVLLHTGDIAKRLPDGNLLFLNRNDWMVKISGQRVEPGEIEGVMRQIPEIKQAVVKSFENTHNQTYLCGFYTVNSTISKEYLRKYLANKLPSYMLPRFLTELAAFPTNVNGKLDRLSLQAPKAAEFQVEYIAPETPEEEMLCRAFETVLDVKSVGALDDFFHIGGDSLGVMSLMVEAERLHLKAEHVFNGKTPRGIAAQIQKDQTTQMDIFVDCQEKRTFYPLTSSQKTVLRSFLSSPWSTDFNNASIYNFPLDIDIQRIQKALWDVFEHYPILSARMVEQDGVYGLVKCPERKPEIPVIDVREDELEQKKKQFVMPFNPERDMLIRMIIYRTEKQIYLFWDTYHMIMDGSSITLFFNQFVRTYYGESLVPEQLTQFHLSNYEQKYRKSELFQQAREYFARKIGMRLSPSNPQFDHPEYVGGARERNNAFYRFPDQTTSAMLERFLKTYDITAATFFMGAFSYTLKELTKNKQVSFLSIENGRHDPRLQYTMGQLIQYIPLIVSFEQEMSDIERLRKIQADFVESWSYGCYPFELLESEYNISDSIVFNYLGEMKNGFQISTHFVTDEYLQPVTSHSNLITCVFKHNNTYELLIGYNSQAYEKNTMDKLIDTYVQTINSFLLLLD